MPYIDVSTPLHFQSWMMRKERCDVSVRPDSEKCHIKKWYFLFILRCFYDISWSDKLRWLQYSHLTEWSDKNLSNVGIISIWISFWETSLINKSKPESRHINTTPGFWMCENIIIPAIKRTPSRKPNIYLSSQLHQMFQITLKPCCYVFIWVCYFHRDHLLAFTQKIKRITLWRKKFTPLSILSHSLPYLRSHSGRNSPSRWNTQSGPSSSICWLNHFGSTLRGNHTKMLGKSASS